MLAAAENLECNTRDEQSCVQETDHQIEEGIAEALACPCVDDLRSGPCGKPFEAAFSCYLRHTAKNKVAAHRPVCLCEYTRMCCDLSRISLAKVHSSRPCHLS